MFGSNRGMEETLFQLKFCSKQLARLSKKAEKEQKKEEGMIKKALTQGDVDRARIYAENAVRSVTEQPSFTVRGSGHIFLRVQFRTFDKLRFGSQFQLRI